MRVRSQPLNLSARRGMVKVGLQLAVSVPHAQPIYQRQTELEIRDAVAIYLQSLDVQHKSHKRHP